MQAINAAIKQLEDYHEKPLSKQAVKDYLSVLGKEQDAILLRAIDEWRYAHPPTDRFPSIAQLISLCHEIKNRAFKKKADVLTLSDAEKNTKSDIAKRCLQLASGLLDKTISVEDAAKELEKMGEEARQMLSDVAKIRENRKRWAEKWQLPKIGAEQW